MPFPKPTLFACGHPRCVAVVRMLWPESHVPIREIAETLGCSYATVHRQAETLGLGIRPGNEWRYRRISDATIRANYHRRDATIHEIANEIGIDPRTLWQRAMSLGMKPRPKGRLFNLTVWPDDFDHLWLSGVPIKDIMRACPKPPKSESNVSLEASQRGLPRRRNGPQRNTISLEEARAKRAMEAASKIEQAAMINAEMADFHHAGRQVGAQHAKGLSHAS